MAGKALVELGKPEHVYEYRLSLGWVSKAYWLSDVIVKNHGKTTTKTRKRKSLTFCSVPMWTYMMIGSTRETTPASSSPQKLTCLQAHVSHCASPDFVHGP